MAELEPAPEQDPGPEAVTQFAVDHPDPPWTTPRPRARSVGPRAVGLSGIGAKVFAVVGGLLLAGLVGGAGLVYQAASLSQPDPQVQAVLANRRASSLVLINARTEESAWNSFLLAGTSNGLRAQRKKEYLDLRKQEDSLVDAMVSGAANPVMRAEFEKFAVTHRAAAGTYDNAMKAFLASKGKDGAAADAATHGLETAALAQLTTYNQQLADLGDELTRQRVARIDTRIRIIVVFGLLGFIMAAAAAVIIVRRVVQPILELVSAAEDIANRKLPSAVAQIRRMQADDPAPALEPVEIRSQDETALLAEAFQKVQDSALNLAIEQQRAHLSSAEMLVNLGRRNQNLLNRALAYITELERTEQEPEVLDRLFRLDHATTRIRRNAESMLVLAGASQTRTWSSPAGVADVIRAALSEVEDYTRVDLYHVDGAAVLGGAVPDIVHLLAELVENATTFSPPDTRITVVGQNVPAGYRIRVIDAGIGMTQPELQAANAIIQQAADAQGATRLIGLYVVGRLAARRDLDVTLEASGGRGVTATVVLPRDLLAATPEVQPQRLSLNGPRPARTAASSGSVVSPGSVVSSGRERSTFLPFAELQSAVNATGRSAGSDTSMVVLVPNGRADRTLPATVPLPSPDFDEDRFDGDRFDGNQAAPPRASGQPRTGRPPHSPGLVRRVPGAQLPDLGPDPLDGPSSTSIDPQQIRGQLSSLRMGAQAGRRAAEAAAGPGGPVPGEIEVPEVTSPPVARMQQEFRLPRRLSAGTWLGAALGPETEAGTEQITDASTWPSAAPPDGPDGPDAPDARDDRTGDPS